MNKRKAKKKRNYEFRCEDIWGYVMSYSELRKQERSYHEAVIVRGYRNIDYSSDLEELSSILGIPYEVQENNYRYPNRLRFHTLTRLHLRGKKT